MSKLFGNSNSDSEDDNVYLKIDNNYANTYDNWRQKEELNKLKTKYGEEALEDSANSSSSETDDGDEEIPQELEKEFFRTLSSLKNKDPKIYDASFEFFKNPIGRPSKSPRKKADAAVYVKDYERKMLLENGVGESEPEQFKMTYVEEQNHLKESLKNALKVLDDDHENEAKDWGGLFKARQKSKVEQKKEEDDYKDWLVGQKDELTDKTAEFDLKPLKDYWSDPNLGEGEKFLKDYILNKRFLDKEEENYVPTYEEIIHDSDDGFSEDEVAIETQEEFEQKYNYRFEEPDQEFIKRYPRSMQNSVRKQDDRRKIKRAETKQRKHEEKQHKIEEIKQMKAMKRKDIEEKIAKLREITGNTDVQFQSEDIEDDFDPDAHDRRMQTLFNDEFYGGVEGEQKPEFPELDDELEIENWGSFEGEEDNEVHCEDEDFNMDCDYDPKQALKAEETKERCKRRRKSKFAKAISNTKPVFNPEDRTYEEYLDEYYKLDCEDIIGDVPCRFKYRPVVANDFGLSVEEILMAKDKELNKWCSIKKAVQYRPLNVEKYDVVAFSRKAQNEALKRKILSSLFAKEEGSLMVKEHKQEVSRSSRKKFEDADKTGEGVITEENQPELPVKQNKKKKKRQQEMSKTRALVEQDREKRSNADLSQNGSGKEFNNKKKNDGQNRNMLGEESPKTNENKQNKNFDKNSKLEESELPLLKQSKKKRKKPENSANESCESSTLQNKKQKSDGINTELGSNENDGSNKKNKHNTDGDMKMKKEKSILSIEVKARAKRNRLKQRRNGNRKKTESNLVKISDARLSAYGFKPKKFKNKMKYGQK